MSPERKAGEGMRRRVCRVSYRDGEPCRGGSVGRLERDPLPIPASWAWRISRGPHPSGLQAPCPGCRSTSAHGWSTSQPPHAQGFRENLRDAGREQGIVVARGTGERGERLHLCCAPLGVLLSHNASSQWQGHPLPAGEGVQEGPQCKPRPLRGIPALLQDPAACPDELKPLTCLSPAG